MNTRFGFDSRHLHQFRNAELVRVASKSLNDLRETVYRRVSPAVFRFPAFAGPGLVTSFGTTPATSTTHRDPMGDPA
ncbi:MAG: hypothetical protein R3F07_03905 [Opitutaceae bacterium]